MTSSKTTLDKIQHVNVLAWILNNNIKTESGQPLDFHDHRYLIGPYSDNSPNLVELKAAQLGLSTMEIIRTMHRAFYKQLDIIYILPSFSDVKDFSGGKVNRIIDNNPILQEWVSDKDSTEQKRVGKSTIYYRGSWNERSALMISADWLILDEFDRSKQEVLEQYESRLQHSKYGYKSIFSNPSAPDFGVDKHFKRTDQKMWFVHHSCGEDILLDEKCIDYDQEKFICPKCKGEITDEERRMGDWKSTTTGEVGWSGYWIPLWISPKISAGKIAEYKRTKTAEYFANFVAGLPFIGGGNKVSASTLLKCLSKEVNDQTDRIIIGVDTGLPIHFVLANKQGFFHYGKCSDPTTGKDPYDELEGFLKRWPNSIMISDQGGDLIGIRKLQAKYPGRVFLVWYRADKKGTELIQWGEAEEYGKVVVDRNRMIQLFIDEMQDKRVVYNGSEADWQEYITHWMNIYRTWDEDSNQVRVFKWERMGKDHYCFDGNTKIKTLRGDISIKDVRTDDLVETRRGYELVRKSWLTQVDAKTVTAVFSNGSRIVATPNHKFITQQGQTTLDSLSYSDKLYEWNKSHIKELFIAAIQSPNGEPTESTSPLMGHYEPKGMFGFISRYGLITLGLSPRVLSFITKMAIRLIMKYQTWLVSQEANIKVSTLSINLKTLIIDEDKKNILNQSDPYHINGAVQKKVKSGIVYTLIKVSYWLNQNILIVLSAILKLLHKVKTVVSSVAPDVVIVGLHENIGRRNVYNLTVEPDHEYYANDILVSNCHCAIYARVGLEKYATSLAKIVNPNIYGDMPTGRIFND